MPRFFFDIDDGEDQFHDDEGVVLADRQVAREEAIGVLPDIARQVLPDGDERVFMAIVRDAKGRTIFRATLSLHAEWVTALN